MDTFAPTIPACFEAQVRRTPEALAVQTRQQALTYAALNALANQIAWAILERCGTGETAVALLLEKDIRGIATFLGILKAGKIFVPLDPSYPQARLHFMLDNAQAPLLLTETRHLALATALTGATNQVLNLETLAPSFPTTDPALSLTPETLAFILYTSGSTGQPKGVVQNHRNVLHSLMNYTHHFCVGPADRVAMVRSLGVIGGGRDILGALLNGASLWPYDLVTEGLAPYAAWLQETAITILNMVVTPFRHFLRMLRSTEQFPAVRLVRLGSEPMAVQDIELFKRHFVPPCQLYNDFGATELSTISLYRMDHQTSLPSPLVPVGYACDGIELVILDEAGAPLGPNQVGELVLKSCYLALGYWRRPDLTLAAFFPDPEGSTARCYRTGDLGRLSADGCLEHLGRRDARVKIRGYLVDVAEVESALLALPDIQQAVVLARERRPDEPHLVAYIVPAQPPDPTPAELRQSLQVRLPAPLIPSLFVQLPALPTTPQGKLDRRALPDVDWGDYTRSLPYTAPRSPIEQELAVMWAAVLGLERVGIHETFLDLGGHSLLAMQLGARIQETFRLTLPLRTLLNAATVADMAQCIMQHLVAETDASRLEQALVDIEGAADTTVPCPPFPET